MFLVLSSSNDYVALWACEGLKRLGIAPLELVTSEDLAYTRFWEHRVGAAGASIRLSLPDGREIRSSRISGVLNRLLSAPQDLVNWARPNDRDYATQELSSFYLSWLYTLEGSVINRPTPQGFCGRWRHTSEWAMLAQRAGLPLPPYKQTAQDAPESGYRSLAPSSVPVQSVIVLRGEIFGPILPEQTRMACRRFAELAGTEMLGLDVFRASDGIWNFAAATPYPDLTIGATPLLEHLAHIFANGRTQ
jgi:hypothetical protein